MSNSIRSKLWQEAYQAILADPDECEVYNKFAKAISQNEGTAPDLSSQDGREKLNKAVDILARDMCSSTSPKVREAFDKFQKFRTLISAGASANPGATVAVAGLFIAFDLVLMHQAEEAYIAEIVLKVADIARRNELLHHFIEILSNDDCHLKEARRELKAAFVQLKRTSLLLTMKIVYKLNRWHKYFLVPGSWVSRLKTLLDAEDRVKDYVRDIQIRMLTPPTTGPNWNQKDEKIPRLHRLVRDGRVNDVWNMIESGQCPPKILNEKAENGWTALMFAARDGQWKIMNYLLRSEKIEVNAKNNDGNTALIIAAQINRLGHVRRLIEAGAKLDIRNKRKRTAWQEAAIKGRMKAMKVLLEKGDDINQVTGVMGFCALHTAVEKDNLALEKWLLEEGARTDIKIKAGPNKGLTPKGLARRLQKEKSLEILP